MKIPPLTQAQHEILEVAALYHYITRNHVIWHTGKSLRHSQERLALLVEKQLLFKQERGKPYGGREPTLYWLTHRARDYLRRFDYLDIPKPHRLSETQIRHVEAVGDVLARCSALARERDYAVEVADLLHDRDLRRMKPPLPVVPDGYVHFVVKTMSGKKLSFPILFEIDMASMNRKRWQEKIEGYLRFFRTSWYEMFGLTDRFVTVATITPSGRKHSDALQKWTEEVLLKHKQEALGAMFFFAPLFKEIEATDFFLTPGFSVAFEKVRHSLLEEVVD